MAANYSNEKYQYSNTAVRMHELEAPDMKKIPSGVGRRGIGAGYVLFFISALIVTAVVLVHYITLRSEVTNKLQNISALQQEYNQLKMDNDAVYSRINSNMDLAMIRDRAINELGMVYAKEGQIRTFTSENGDYVRQLSSVGD